MACELAIQARKELGKKREVLIAGSLPPLHGSYKPKEVGEVAKIVPIYRQHVEIMAPYVDLFLCETMSTGTEAWAAVSEATKSGKPVWVSWTIKDDVSGLLRSGET